MKKKENNMKKFALNKLNDYSKIKGGDGTAASRQLEHRTVPNVKRAWSARHATSGGDAEEIAARVHDNTAEGPGSVRPVEHGESGDSAAAGSYLVHRAQILSALAA